MKKQIRTIADLQNAEWFSAKDIELLFNCSRSYFLYKLKPRLKEYKWSERVIRYNRKDVLELSEYLKNGGVL